MSTDKAVQALRHIAGAAMDITVERSAIKACAEAALASLDSKPAIEQAEPAPGDWRHLMRFGYAPGNYLSRCHRCEEVAKDVDKRAVTCRACAEAMFAEAERQATQPAIVPPTTPATGWTGDPDADLALILLDRLDDTGEDNACRIEQLEGIVRKLAALPRPQPFSNAELERLYANIAPSAQQDARSREAFKRIARIVEAGHGIVGDGDG